MKIKLDYEQWKRLKELVLIAGIMESKTTTGEVRLADQETSIEIYEHIILKIP